MKRNLQLIFLLIVFFACSEPLLAQRPFPQPYSRSTAQLADRFPHIIKVNFLSPFVLTANVSYEHFLNPNMSLQLGAYYNGITLKSRDFFWFNLPRARYRSFAITPEFRFYTGDPARPKLSGFYVGPFLRYQNTGIRITPEQQDPEEGEGGFLQETYEGTLHNIRVGAVAGYKLIIGQHLSLEAFAGPSVRVAHWLNANVNTYEAERFLPFGLLLRSGMTIGYAF